MEYMGRPRSIELYNLQRPSMTINLDFKVAIFILRRQLTRK